MKKAKPLTISVDEELKKQIEETASSNSMTKSELLRQAFKKYKRDILKEKIAQKKLQQKAQELGIETPEDVNQLVDEIRS